MSVLNQIKGKKSVKEREKEKRLNTTIKELFLRFSRHDFEKHYNSMEDGYSVISGMYYSKAEDTIYISNFPLKDGSYIDFGDKKPKVRVIKRIKEGNSAKYDMQDYFANDPLVCDKAKKIKTMIEKENTVAIKQADVWKNAGIEVVAIGLKETYPADMFDRFSENYKFEMSTFPHKKINNCDLIEAYYYHGQGVIYHCSMICEKTGNRDVIDSRTHVIKKCYGQFFSQCEELEVEDVYKRVQTAMHKMCTIEWQAQKERTEIWTSQSELEI